MEKTTCKRKDINSDIWKTESKKRWDLESEECSERRMDFRWKTHLLPCSFRLPCAYECVMTDVVPCCFPAEDGLKVHQEGSLDIQPLIQDASKTPRTAGQIINTKRIVVVLNSHWRTFKNSQWVYNLCSFSRLSTTCRENNMAASYYYNLEVHFPATWIFSRKKVQSQRMLNRWV